MFRNAYAIARQYTWPVVLSRKTIGGTCSSTIGACVVVNDEGWIVTAGHILEQINTLHEGAQLARDVEAQRNAIESDTTINPNEKRRRLLKMKKSSRKTTQIAVQHGGGKIK